MTQRWQFPVFVAIGLVSAAVDIFILQVLVWSGFHYTVAVTLGFLTGFLVNYLGHTRVTFKKQETVANVLGFILVVLLNYLITLSFVALSEVFLDSVVTGKIVSLPVVAVNGFLWGKYLVFK
ncbi:MAG: GtrA family protein [Halioglobus sp.]|nr:GtrA family protein [Halioglobus sp.]